MARPRIFIGVPCYDTVVPEILDDWLRWFYHLGRRMPEYDFFHGLLTKKEQFRARNAIVEAAQQVNANWLLMLDDDMIIGAFRTSGVDGEGSGEYDFLAKMIAHDKDICGALYYQRTGACSPVLMTKVDETGYRFLRDDEITGGLQRVDVAGGGCLLIKMRLFDRLKHPYFEPEFKHGTDIQLCRQAQAQGYEVWADTAIEFGHVRNERVIVTSRNRAQFQLSDPVPGDITRQFVASDIYTRLLADACEWSGYANLEEMSRHAHAFMRQRATSGLSDVQWYRQFFKERVARQVWFNHTESKRRMTEFILAAIDHSRPLEILDFGCGIGIPAFTLAERGHRVTACDLGDTGTFDFLKWRAKRHGVPLMAHDTQGGLPPFGGARFDVIVAMDCLEHIKDWRGMLRHLTGHLKSGGALFANNAVLDDTTHPEHYDLKPKDFLRACVDLDLAPVNAITYLKQAPRTEPETSHAESPCAVA